MLNLETIQQQNKEFFSKIKEFVFEHKLQSMLILLLMLLLLLLCLLMSFTKKDEKILGEIPYPYNLIHPYETTIEDEIDSYYFSRDEKESWSKEESLEWFSDPGGILLKELEDKNSKKISDILEAAP